MKHKNYIPVKNHWFDMFTKHFEKQYWTPESKVPVSKIKIDKNLFDYQNEVDNSLVLDIVLNFNHELWIPLTINQAYYLLDGQHRLAAAQQLGLEYIDVVIQDTELLECE
jgi:hypothetical protein